MVFKRLAHTAQQLYKTTREALHDWSEPDSKQESCKVELERRKKSDKESWVDIALTVSGLAISVGS